MEPLRPLAVDLYTGLHGWAEGLVAEGFGVVGFDLEDMCASFNQPRPEHVQLVVQDVLTLHGRQFKDAALIVASPPCQEFSYMAMPWKRAKQRAADYRAGVLDVRDLTRLFDACFRIQREACEAAGHHIPLVVENVRGAQPWVGRSRWNYGSYHLFGDVPALMPMTKGRTVMKEGIAHRSDGSTNFHQGRYDDHTKHPGHDWNRFKQTGEVSPHWRLNGEDSVTVNPRIQRERDERKNSGGSWFNVAHNTTSGHGRNPDGRNDPRDDIKVRAHLNQRNGHRSTSHLTNPAEHIKCGGDWFGPGEDQSAMRNHNSKSPKRKAASAMIAKIPLQLARHIARTFYPR